MKTILAYGDSITWGSDPARGGARHPASHRWPDVLAREDGGLLQQACERGCGFFDASTVASPLPIDRVHLDAENTAAIGRALVTVVRDCLVH
jgi:lysophospholipase L1-like esterase